MKATDSVEKRLATLLISLTICALSFSNSAMAGADIKAESTLTVQQIKPAKPSQYSGSGLMDSAYPGQAIAAIGKYQSSLVKKRNTVSWGLNAKGISILKRF